MFLTIISLCLIHSSMGLVAYDCGSKSLNITTLSLLDVGPCDKPHGNLNISKKNIQLLQINDYLQNTIIQCKIESHRTIHYCGMHSHVSIVQHGETEYIYDISRKNCLDAYYGRTLYLGTMVLDRLQINDTQTFPAVFAGFVDNEGNCVGTSYKDPYGSWESVVVHGKVKISIRERQARVHLNNDRIILPSGTTCALSDGSCIDVEGGYTFWDRIPTDGCNFHQFGTLFNGIANKIVDTNKKKRTNGVCS